MGDKKASLAIAFATQRASRKKKARGISEQDSNTAPESPKSPMTTAKEQAKARNRLDMEHSRDACKGEGCPGCMDPECYAYGGVIGGKAPGERQDGDSRAPRPGYGSQGSGSDMAASHSIDSDEDKDQRMEDSGYQGIADRIRKRRMMAEGGRVDPDSDEGAYAETFDDMNESMADGELYDDGQIESQPKDSNEKGDKLSDEDEHAKSMFKRIKMKKAQKGDRGDY